MSWLDDYYKADDTVLDDVDTPPEFYGLKVLPDGCLLDPKTGIVYWQDGTKKD